MPTEIATADSEGVVAVVDPSEAVAEEDSPAEVGITNSLTEEASVVVEVVVGTEVLAETGVAAEDSQETATIDQVAEGSHPEVVVPVEMVTEEVGDRSSKQRRSGKRVLPEIVSFEFYVI